VSAPSLYNEKQILLAIAGGDAIAFAQLYEHYRRKVYFIAWRLLQSENEAEDVQQEIFTKIWLNRSKLAEITQFNSYVNTLIRNYVYNAIRKKANETAYIREAMKMKDSNPEDAFVPAEINELQTLLRAAINNLPRQQKKVFQLVRMEGRKHEEVAGLLGISKETVKKHIMEAQRAVTAFFESRGKTTLFLLLMLSLQ
jgi:RNA polymerase sigma-70 factor (ECF subfamily)